MRNVFNYIFLILVLGFILGFTYYNRDKYVTFFNSLHPCSTPITYRVDTVDSQFNLKRDTFITDVKQAADIWNKQNGKSLFQYSENGKVSVNLIYDERQAESNKINQLDQQLQSQKGQLDAQITDYRNKVADFKTRLAAHNAEVQSWNDKGGAPQEEYDKLSKEKDDLQAEADKLNELAKKLNLTSENYNLGVGKLNSAIGDFNTDLVKKPEEGIFMGDKERIEIYFNNDKQELIHTLAHELGHSIGLEHVVNNQKAIMYPYTTKTIVPTVDDINSLNEICRNKSILEVISSRLSH